MRTAVFAMLTAALCGGQTTVNGGRVFSGPVKATGASATVDFTGALSTAPLKTGTTATRPAACTLGDMYFSTDAAAGQNLALCTTTGNPGGWTAIAGGGGGSTGSGVTYCAPSSASTSTYACAPSPAATAYSTGMTLAFLPDVSGAGGATTVNVNGLGAKSIKLGDGTTNPSSLDLNSGRVYVLVYDGSLFRISRAVQPNTSVSHQFLTSVNADGTVSAAQPVASDVSGLATSATTDTTNASNISSGTLGSARLPLPSATTVGGVKSAAAVSHQFVTAIGTDGSISRAQPAAGDVTGLATSATTDTTNASNIASGTLGAARLPLPSATTVGGVKSAAAVSHQFVTAIGTDGSVSQAQPAAADVSGLAASATTDATNASNIASGTLGAARLPLPSATTVGGVKSAAAVSHQFVTAIGTDGSVSQGQPAAGDVSGLAASATTDTTNASNIATGTLADARLSTNVAMGNRTNTYTAYNDYSGGSWRAPEATVATLPAAAGVTGRIYLVTDSQNVGSCTSGGGSSRTMCRSTGSVYECVGNCSGGGGGGTPGGLSGQIQYNSSGSFAGQAYVLSRSPYQRGVECSTGTVDYTNLTAASTAQEISILTAVPAKFRYHHVLVQEAVQFAGTPTLTVSMGTPGVDTDLALALSLKQATTPQNYFFETPRPPAVGNGSYNLVLQFVGSANLGNGSASNFTAGSVNWEVCGFSVQ